MDDRWSVVLRMGLLFGTKQQGESDDSLHQPKESSSVMKRDGRSKVQTERVGVGGAFPSKLHQAPPRLHPLKEAAHGIYEWVVLHPTIITVPTLTIDISYIIIFSTI